MDATVARGRWSNAKVVKNCIDDGALALSEMQWTSAQKRAVRKWAKRLHTFYTLLRKVRGKLGAKWVLGVFTPAGFPKNLVDKWEVFTS